MLQKLVDCLAPGGTLFVEEPDAISVRTLDRSGFRSLCLRVFEIVQSRGSHPDWSRDLPFKMTSLGLGNVRAEGETPYSAAPRSSPSSGESVGDACAMRSLKRERISRNGIANWRSSTIPRDCS